jgi:glycosyltransferase involved in cell wall biosynthesis
VNLTVTIIARDEARHIGAAVESAVGIAEVVVLLDARTTDASAVVARAAGATVAFETWRGFPAQRNAALARCTTPWLLFLDADERITPELAAEIQQLLADTPTHDAYRMPRHNIFFRHTVRGGGWYPDHQVRLLRVGRVQYDEQVSVHEITRVAGSTGQLHGHLLHLNIERFGELWHKQRRYALEEAQTLRRTGRRARWRNLVGAPLREFYRRYIELGGYRDGWVGMVLCGTIAYFEIVKFVHLMAIQRQKV